MYSAMAIEFIANDDKPLPYQYSHPMVLYQRDADNLVTCFY